MTHFDGTYYIVYSALFEKQTCRMYIAKEKCGMYLLSLFPIEIVNNVAREANPKTKARSQK